MLEIHILDDNLFAILILTRSFEIYSHNRYTRIEYLYKSMHIYYDEFISGCTDVKLCCFFLIKL